MSITKPTVICPFCGEEIKLTESLAAPLLAATKRDFDTQLAKKDADIVSRETSLHEQEEKLLKEKSDIERQVSKKIEMERSRIITEEAKKARLYQVNEFNQKVAEIDNLQEVLKQQDSKLAEAQKTQVELLRKQRELDDAKRELDLTVEQRVQEGLDATRTQARKEAEGQLGLKVMEKEQTILSMQRQIEELRRKAEQGSQQLQGEVQELALETLLKSRFPQDNIDPVPKGEHGGDIVHNVVSAQGRSCGIILWESKRTKNWSDGWLTKLRDDQRAAKADIAVIVSQALPKDVETFELIEGVWVTHPRAAIPMATVLRHSLLELARAKIANEGLQTKTEMVYEYLTGSQFRQRVEAIVEAFSTMYEDLSKERKVITKQWFKREAQIERVMNSTVGMYGDLQGLMGASLEEIKALDLKQLTEGMAHEAE